MPSALARSKRTSIHREETTTTLYVVRVGIASMPAHCGIHLNRQSLSSLQRRVAAIGRCIASSRIVSLLP
jgi:hypothetical protein